MKKQIVQDERIITAKRKIQSDGFSIVWLVLIISILIQQYLYNAPFSQYAVEFLVFIAMSIYVLIANIRIGNDIFFTEKKGHSTIILNSLVTGITVTVINTMINYINYSDKIQSSIITHLALVALITFISCTTLAFITLKVFHLYNQKKQQAINDKLNKEDMIE